MNKMMASVLLSTSLLFSTVSFSADLPTLLDNQMSASEVQIGHVSVSGIRGSSDDAIKKLQEKSAALGGSKLRIVSLGTPGDSSLWMGTAQVFK